MEERRRRSERTRNENNEKVESSSWTSKEPETYHGIVTGAPLLNFRSRPEKGDNVIGTLRNGDAFEILGKVGKGEYCKIRTNDGTVGYIASAFCKEV